MPMPLCAIPSFEKRNRCSINVYQMETSKLVSVYHSKNRRGRHKIDLLRLMDNQNSHHCHLSGTIFGVAHSNCNLRARTTNFLPVFFYNLSRYDAHHILKRLKLKVDEELSAIAKIDETYISFSINIPVGTYKKQPGQLVKLYQSFRFLDSYQSVSQSLENLAKTLKKDDFFLLKQFFHNVPDQIVLKLTQKGFLHYSYLDTFEKFKEPFPNYGDAWKNSPW